MNTLTSKLLPGVLIGLVMVFMISSTGFAAMQSMASSQCNTLQQDSSHGIKYMSAGVGLDQRQAIMHKDLAKGYDLKMVFANKSGAYVSDVNVTIKGAGHKTLLNTEACGPWFYTKLPSGQYKVTVSHDGKSESRSVTVGNGFKVVIFRWS